MLQPTTGEPLAIAIEDAETEFPGASFARATDRENFCTSLLERGIKAHVHFNLKYSCCDNELVPVCSLGRYVNDLPVCEYATGNILTPDETVSRFQLNGILCPHCRVQPLASLAKQNPGNVYAQFRWYGLSITYGSDPFSRAYRTVMDNASAVRTLFRSLANHLSFPAEEAATAALTYMSHKTEVDRMCRERIKRDDVAPDHVVVFWEEKYKHKNERRTRGISLG